MKTKNFDIAYKFCSQKLLCYIIYFVIWKSIFINLSLAGELNDGLITDIKRICSNIERLLEKNEISQNKIKIKTDMADGFAEIEFRPNVDNWKIAVLSLFANEGSPKIQVRVLPPCQINLIRKIEEDQNGDPIINSFGSNLEMISSEPQNPPLTLTSNQILPTEKPMLALVDTGVNYNLPWVQENLALDQKGKIIGYDFWDDDHRPFDKDPRRNLFFPQHHGTSVFSVLKKELSSLRVAIYRFPALDMCRFSELINHAKLHDIRIVNMSMGSAQKSDWKCFYDSVKLNPEMLFVVSAGNDGRNIDLHPIFPASFKLNNIIVVTSTDIFGRLPPDSNFGRNSVDFMVPAERLDAIDHRGVKVTTGGSSYAAPRVAALATRFLSKSNGSTTKEIINFLKSRAINLDTNLVKFGWIPDPSDNFGF